MSDFPLPELLLYFDLSPAQSLGRIGGRGRLDIFEDLPFQEKVRLAYDRALDSYAGSGMKIVRIDASRSVKEVSREILSGNRRLPRPLARGRRGVNNQWWWRFRLSRPILGLPILKVV